MSSITLLRARVAELEEENVYLQQQIEQLKQQQQQQQRQRAPKPSINNSSTADDSSSQQLSVTSSSSSSSSSASPLSSSSSPLPGVADGLSHDSQLHQQSLLLSALGEQLQALQQENAVLRSQHGSKSLLMSFSLMDGLKEEKEQLRAEVDRLRMQMFVMEERRKRRDDRKGTAADEAADDSSTAAAEVLQASEETKEEEQSRGQEDSAAGEVEAQGQPTSANEEKEDNDDSNTAAEKAIIQVARTETQPPSSDDNETDKLTSAEHEERDEEKLDENASKDKEKDGADKRRVKKLIKDKRSKTSPPTSTASSPDASPPSQSVLSPTSSSASPSALSLPSSTLRITSNRLPFMEDSPLYRQQLDNMRVRVSQMFSRLDHLAEKASEYSRSALAFSRAGEAFADELDRSWADVEVEDGGEEKKLMEEERKREKDKKRKQSEREKAAKNGTPATRKKAAAAGKRRTRESSEGISSASIAEAAQLDSAFLNIGLNNRGQSNTPTPGSAGTGSSSDAASIGSSSSAPSVTSPLSAAIGGANTLGVAASSAAKLRASTSNSSLSIKSFLSDIQAKVSDVLNDKDSHSPSSSPLTINTASAVASHRAHNEPDSAPQIPPTKRLSHSTRAATVSPTSASASLTPFSDSQHHFQSISDLHHADRLQLDLEARQRAERQKHPIPEQPVSLTNAMSKMSSIVSTSAEITRNLSAFIDHVLVNAVRSVGEKYSVAVSKTQLSMNTLLGDYELALQARLAKRKQERERHFNVLNMFGQRRTYDEEYQRLCQLRREMELRRFDHIQLLNEVCTAKRTELIEVMCASFLSFVTFFHEGWFAANYVKDEVDMLQEELTKRRVYYQKQAKLTLAQRQRLLKSALPINLPVIFPLSNWHSLSENNKTTTMSGYLRQPLDDSNPNKVREWKRRWFVLEGGTFYYLNEAEYYQPKHVVNVLTCAARPWSKSSLDFCFELISPTRTFVYQAESEYEMKAWVAVFANSTEQLLGQQQTRSDTNALDSKLNVSVLEQQKRVKAGLLSQLRRDNCYCAECSARDPDWASINLGIMICIVCSGIHRSLGVHISKVRSMTLDDWDTELLDMMVGIGNDKSNSVYEGALDDDDIGHGSRSGRSGDAGHSKPSANSSHHEKEEFIQMKYVRRAFLSKQMLHLCGDVQQMGQRMWQACESDDDLGQLILLHALGCPVGWLNEREEGRTLLHHAAEYDSVQCVEWLIQNNADVEATDRHGMTPLALAKANQSKLVIRRLEGGNATPATTSSSGASSAASSGSSTPVAKHSGVSATPVKDEKVGKSVVGVSKPRV